MTFYIYEKNNRPVAVTDENILGNMAFKNFWCGQGFDLFTIIVENDLDYSDFEIENQSGKKLTFDEFGKIIQSLKLIF